MPMAPSYQKVFTPKAYYHPLEMDRSKRLKMLFMSSMIQE
jgi:hypothetical protein